MENNLLEKRGGGIMSYFTITSSLVELCRDGYQPFYYHEISPIRCMFFVSSTFSCAIECPCSNFKCTIDGQLFLHIHYWNECCNSPEVLKSWCCWFLIIASTYFVCLISLSVLMQVSLISLLEVGISYLASTPRCSCKFKIKLFALVWCTSSWESILLSCRKFRNECGLNVASLLEP